MKKVVLKIENVSKKYRLGATGSGSMSQDIMRWWYKVRGKEDPYASVGVVNDRTVAGGEYVWALKNINIEIKEGEVVGIIGKNGAGKSTLLKLLSKITTPTEGSIKTRGRMASLLEVGTGFHPELTGRQNIYLNGIILGMSKKEINDKLDEIVEFSGCAKYIDTPSKRYSTGMRVRLGFAVAAFLEPDIMVVDEVLAVGDAEFQKLAIKKMKDVSTQSGRTVLFVSHNMNSIKNLCSRVIVLKEGMIDFEGGTEEGIEHYLKLNIPNQTLFYRSFEDTDNTTICYVKNIKTHNPQGKFSFIEEQYSFNLTIVFKELVADVLLGIIVDDENGNQILVSSSDEVDDDVFRKIKKPGEYITSFSFPGKILKPGFYFVTFSLRGATGSPYHKVEKAISFEVEDSDTFRGIKNRYRATALIAPEVKYSIYEHN
jgi:lipopolysaccharide transport system ATP-binding protein